MPEGPFLVILCELLSKFEGRKVQLYKNGKKSTKKMVL